MGLAVALALGRGNLGKFSEFFTSNQLLSLIPDFSIGIATAIFLFLTMRGTDHDESPLKSRFLKGARRLSGFSYSLYLTHLPFLVFLQAWLVGSRRWQPTIANLVFAMGLLLIVILQAYLFSLVTEHFTDPLRKLLMGFFGKSSPQNATFPAQNEAIARRT